MQIIEDIPLDPTGLWTTADGAVRKLLLPNGRYLVMKGHRSEWREGDYVIAGAHIEYRGDNGARGISVIEGGVIYSANGVPLFPEGYEDVAA